MCRPITEPNRNGGRFLLSQIYISRDMADVGAIGPPAVFSNLGSHATYDAHGHDGGVAAT